MATFIPTGSVHHLRLTVTDVDRSRKFYTELLGFDVLVELPPGVLLANGSVLVGMGPPPNPEEAIDNDRFTENRVGLDHLSFAVTDRSELEKAAALLDEHNVPRGEITDLGEGFGIYILAFRDPDNIQLELTAPYPPLST